MNRITARIGNTMVCPTSSQYDMHGVKKEGNSYFTTTQTASTRAVTVIAENESNQVNCDCSKAITKVVLNLSKVEMSVENLIGALYTIYNEGTPPIVARALLAPVMLGVASVVYAQIHYVVQSAERAIAGNQDQNTTNNNNIVTRKHQLQALASLLSSIMEGIKYYFTVFAIYQDSLPTRIAAVCAGVQRGTSFFMTKGHSTTDIPIGNTAIGSAWYGAVTAPIVPDVISYADSTMPVVGFIIHMQAILTVASMVEDVSGIHKENPIFWTAAYALASISAMLESFIVQRSFSCDKLAKYTRENQPLIDSWKKMWFGDEEYRNPAQIVALGAKYGVNVLFALPLACLAISERTLRIVSFLLMSALPIQILSSACYISRLALVYRVFYVFIHSAPEMFKLYFNADVKDSLTKQEEMLLSLIALPLAFTLGYAVLTACGGSALKLTDKVFRSGANEQNTANEEAGLINDMPPAHPGFTQRVRGSLSEGKRLVGGFGGVVKNLIKV